MKRLFKEKTNSQMADANPAMLINSLNANTTMKRQRLKQNEENNINVP